MIAQQYEISNASAKAQARSKRRVRIHLIKYIPLACINL
jgi:hypothetical protein